MKKSNAIKGQEPGSVLVLYESLAAREQAIKFSEQLTEQSGSAPQPGITWCSFESLCKGASAVETVKQAAQARLIIFAITGGGELTHEIKMWTEKWLNKRGEREGALVGLVLGNATNPCAVAGLKEIYLRHLAHRAGMDYLSHVPQVIPRTMVDSLGSFSQRAGQMTSVMDDILNTRFVPPSVPL